MEPWIGVAGTRVSKAYCGAGSSLTRSLLQQPTALTPQTPPPWPPQQQEPQQLLRTAEAVARQARRQGRPPTPPSAVPAGAESPVQGVAGLPQRPSSPAGSPSAMATWAQIQQIAPAGAPSACVHAWVKVAGRSGRENRSRIVTQGRRHFAGICIGRFMGEDAARPRRQHW